MGACVVDDGDGEGDEQQPEEEVEWSYFWHVLFEVDFLLFELLHFGDAICMFLGIGLHCVSVYYNV